jgi:hypothetical protein
MDDRRDPPAEPGSHPLITPTGDLPTAQQAHLDYNSHVIGSAYKPRCERCSDVDRGRCGEGEELWQAWNKALDAAYEQLHHGAP